MALKTREDYLRTLRNMRSNVYKFGELIKDVTSNNATKRVVESHALNYDASHDKELENIYTTTSSLTGEKIHRWNSLMSSSDDLIANMKLKRQNYRRTGSCTGGVCVGWNLQNVMWAVTQEMDEELGTNYSDRLRKWVLHSQENGLIVAGALTDAKGNRSLKPSMQQNRDANLRIVEVKKEGIVIRGAKLMIAGIAASHEIFISPGAIYGEADKDYVVSCVIPRDIQGLTIIEATRPSDRRDLEDLSCKEVPDTGATQGLLFFEDVLVPSERVFMCGEYQYTANLIRYFTSNYRACIGACVSGQGDMMIGASVLMARANGLSSRIFMNKLVEMSINNQITYGLGAGACAIGSKHSSGAFFADAHTAHTNKVMVAQLPYETKRLTQEIGGGIVETGCMPSYKDFTNPEYGKMVQDYYKAGDCSAETRYKIARLSEWLTVGGGIPGCMHGGGSPDGARIVVRATTPFEEYVNYAKNIMKIEEDVLEPRKK